MNTIYLHCSEIRMTKKRFENNENGCPPFESLEIMGFDEDGRECTPSVSFLSRHGKSFDGRIRYPDDSSHEGGVVRVTKEFLAAIAETAEGARTEKGCWCSDEETCSPACRRLSNLCDYLKAGAPQDWKGRCE